MKSISLAQDEELCAGAEADMHDIQCAGIAASAAVSLVRVGR